MKPLLPSSSPSSERDLLRRCLFIEGFTFSELALFTAFPIPQDANRRKGWTGMAIERALGASAGNASLPDFCTLGIELKTIPLKSVGKPSESTFVTSIPLLTIHQQKWHFSQCYQKLKHVLWVPVEGDIQIPFEQRRIGQACLWQPNAAEEKILKEDWLELTSLIATGKLETIDASMGEYLQVRPKGANAKSLCYGYDAQGNRILTLPRGFYLRTRFTATILCAGYRSNYL